MDGGILDTNEGVQEYMVLDNVEYRRVDSNEGVEELKKNHKGIFLNVTNDEIESTIQRLTTVPDDLDDIMTRADQVWNCDEIWIDHNGKCRRAICTYKWCDVEII